jgi:hypothetical protein
LAGAPRRNSLGAGIPGGTGRFLPGENAHGLAEADASTGILAPIAAAPVLAIYLAAALAAAAATLDCRPVPLPS